MKLYVHCHVILIHNYYLLNHSYNPYLVNGKMQITRIMYYAWVYSVLPQSASQKGRAVMKHSHPTITDLVLITIITAVTTTEQYKIYDKLKRENRF